jgi:hypothetical protein
MPTLRFGQRMPSKTHLIDLAVEVEAYGAKHGLGFGIVPAHHNPLGEQCRDYVNYVNVALDRAPDEHLAPLLALLTKLTGDARARALAYDPARPGRPLVCWVEEKEG